MGEYNKYDNVHSIKVRAGNRRTYFFDVKQTKGEDYYLSITESTRKFNSDHIERHKIFVYKEDFNKFLKSLQETVDHIKGLMPDYDFEEFDRRNAEWEAKRALEQQNQEHVESGTETSDALSEDPSAIQEGEGHQSTSSSEDEMSW